MSRLRTRRKFVEATAIPAAAALGRISGPNAVIISDSSPPTVPQNLRSAETGATSVYLNWDASSDTGSGVAGYRLYMNGANTPFAETPLNLYSVIDLTTDVTYTFTVSAFDNQGNESAQSSVLTVTPTQWGVVANISFPQGAAATSSFSDQAPVGASAFIISTVGQSGVPNTAKIAELAARGITLDSANQRFVYDGVGTGGAVADIELEDVADSAADWQSRISGPGVVWFHGFESDNEVNNFRWADGLGSGNNPQGVDVPGGRYNDVYRITTDGSDKGAGRSCLQITRSTRGQTTTGNNNQNWWRPFSPIVGGTTSGNGRGAGKNDPGANGSITPKNYNPTQGGAQIYGWSGGVYANPLYAPVTPSGQYDGNEWYLQCRVKVDPRRIQGGNAGVAGGKLFYFTRCDKSATSQEIVVESGRERGGLNMFSMYRSVSPAIASDPPTVAVHGDQPGTTIGTVNNGVCRFDNSSGRRANCWFWPVDKWVTLLWHIVPGTGNGLDQDGHNNTLVETWVAEEGETAYRQIWNQPGVDLPFDVHWGHAAVICSIYQNENQMTEFWHRYDQMIFSKQFIPCPAVW